ncbi:hypothetical protein RI367_003269 [Sorochytrium milnesiophthora]
MEHDDYGSSSSGVKRSRISVAGTACTYQIPKRRGPPKQKSDNALAASAAMYMMPGGIASATAGASPHVVGRTSLGTKPRSLSGSDLSSMMMDSSGFLADHHQQQQQQHVVPSDGAVHAGAAHDANEVESLTDMMTLLVTLQEDGQVQGLRNLGSSSGMQLLRNMSQQTKDAVLLLPSVIKRHIPRGAERALPPREISVFLLDFYFENLHAYLPVVERKMVYASLDSEDPPLLLLNCIFSISSRSFEHMARSNGWKPDDDGSPPPSTIFLDRARLMGRNILLEPACLEYIQGLLILSFHELGMMRGSTWLLSGVAIRMAQDMGLNRNTEDITGSLKITRLQKHIMRKTWAACMCIDRFVCALLGRPLAINEEDCDMGPPSELDEATLSQAGEPEHIKSTARTTIQDSVQLLRLMEIQGRILRNINSVRNQTKLRYSLPEVHTSLSQWFNALPEHLRYSFGQPAAAAQAADGRVEEPLPSLYAAFLNVTYYTTVILLYRPFIVSKGAKRSPLYPQYLHICSTAAQAIAFICHARSNEVLLMPSIVLYSIFTAITTLIITFSSDVASRPSVVANLFKIFVTLRHAQDVWPLAHRLGLMLQDFFAQNQVPVDASQAFDALVNYPALPKASATRNPDNIEKAYRNIMDMKENSSWHASTSPSPSLSPSPAPLSQLPRPSAPSLSSDCTTSSVASCSDDGRVPPCLLARSERLDPAEMGSGDRPIAPCTAPAAPTSSSSASVFASNYAANGGRPLPQQQQQYQFPRMGATSMVTPTDSAASSPAPNIYTRTATPTQFPDMFGVAATGANFGFGSLGGDGGGLGGMVNNPAAQQQPQPQQQQQQQPVQTVAPGMVDFSGRPLSLASIGMDTSMNMSIPWETYSAMNSNAGAAFRVAHASGVAGSGGGKHAGESSLSPSATPATMPFPVTSQAQASTPLSFSPSGSNSSTLFPIEELMGVPTQGMEFGGLGLDSFTDLQSLQTLESLMAPTSAGGGGMDLSALAFDPTLFATLDKGFVPSSSSNYPNEAPRSSNGAGAGLADMDFSEFVNTS